MKYAPLFAFSIIFALLSGLPACHTGSGDCDHGESCACHASTAKLDGNWKLLDDPGLAGQKLKRPPGISIEFSADRRVGGFAGVNRFFGPYLVSGTSLKLGPLGTTMMAGEHSGYEAGFLRLLDQVNGCRADGNVLELRRGREILLIFTRGD
jgi:heat shock protein HslJ